MPALSPLWRDRLLALAAGLAAALAHPPFGLLPGLLGYALLMWLIDRVDGPRPLRSALLRGWLAGSAYFALSTWWIAEAFFVDAANQGWMAPFAVTFMATGLGLFWGAAAVLYQRFRPAGVLRVLAFAGALTLFEWLRGHLLTGFPWNLPGETWKAGSAPSQFASVVGAYGLTWITLAIAAAPALLVPNSLRRRPELIAVGAALAGLVFLYGFGLMRPSAPPAAGPTVRIVQADVKQVAKYDPAWFAEIVRRYTTMTAAPPLPGHKRADIVIWPEGAIPASINDYLAPDTWTRQAIMDALTPGQILLVGAYRVDGPPEKPLYYNTFIALRRTADGLDPLGVYDKHRLVPFGEYMPLEGLMSAIGFKTLVHVGEGFSAGPPPRPLTAPGLPVIQTLICYESLFPGFTRAGARASGRRPDVIINPSNDAWYGATSGPWQNLNLSSYRAIEEGVPMLRATPTGVSAVIDSYGRSSGRQLDQGITGVLDASIPARLSPTLYSRFGDTFLWLLIALSALVSTPPIIALVLKRRDNPASRDA